MKQARPGEERVGNRITISRFEKLIEDGPFRFAAFEAVPIRRLKRIANRVTREFTTATVRCRLVPREVES